MYRNLNFLYFIRHSERRRYFIISLNTLHLHQHPAQPSSWASGFPFALSVRLSHSERASELITYHALITLLLIFSEPFGTDFKFDFVRSLWLYKVSKVTPLAKDKNRTSILEKQGSTKTVICTTRIFSEMEEKDKLFEYYLTQWKGAIFTATVIYLKTPINTPRYSLKKVTRTNFSTFA